MRLQTINPHPRDKDIFLDHKTHTYAVKGYTAPLPSVTSLIQSYLKPTRAEDILSKRYDTWQSNSTERPDLYGLSKKEILSKWIQAGSQEAAHGTTLHRSIERFYNGLRPLITPELATEWCQFNLFCTDNKLNAYRTEMPIYSERHLVAGTVDLIATHSNNTFCLYDWKRTKYDIYSRYAGQGTTEYGCWPLHTIPNNNDGRHSMQLNLYRAILEAEYNCSISSMYVVQFHSSVSSYQCKQVPRLREAELLLTHHAASKQN